MENSSKKIKAKLFNKYVFLTTLLVVLITVTVFALETILYHSTFDYRSQPTNEYNRYSTLTYTSKTPQENGKEETIEVLFHNEGNKDIFIYFHGNIGRLNYILDYLNDHTSFAAPAYPGYHRSSGEPSVQGTLNSINELLPKIVEEFGQDIRLHLIGHSLGSQTASYFAHLLKDDPRLKSLSLVAGFPSIKKLCQNTLGSFSFLCFLANKSFNAASYLQEIGRIKVNVYHLPSDKRISYQDGRNLFDAIPLPEGKRPGEKTFYNFSSGTHGDFDIDLVVNNALRDIIRR